jgi:uncharacterized protein YneF (UPF0154 family)
MILSMTLEIWQFIIILLLVLIIAAIATFFITRKIFANQLKKNPPVSEAMIRAMMTQMGRTPSEKQVRAVMRSMEDEKTKEERAKKAAKNK